MTDAISIKEMKADFCATTQEIEKARLDYLEKNPVWLTAAFKYDPALKKYGNAEALLGKLQEDPAQVEAVSYPGLTAMAAHEEAHTLYHKAVKNITDEAQALLDFAGARRLSETAKAMSGIDIHPGAQLGKDLFIDHGTGVVIGETAIVGDGCFLLHGVTLGGARATKGDDQHPEPVVGGVRRHPKLGNNVVVGSNANVYGGCDIGDNVFIKTGATIRDSDISRYAGGEKDKVSRTDIGTETRITNSKIREGAKIYANVNIFKSQIGEQAIINANADLTDCVIGEKANIGINAKLIDCVIGEGAIIGNGVSLEGVVVPPYAEIQEIKTAQPKLVIYDTNYEGKVTAVAQAVSAEEHAMDETQKSAITPDFIELKDIPNTILKPEDISLMREAQAFINQWKHVIEGQQQVSATSNSHSVH